MAIRKRTKCWNSYQNRQNNCNGTSIFLSVTRFQSVCTYTIQTEQAIQWNEEATTTKMCLKSAWKTPKRPPQQQQQQQRNQKTDRERTSDFMKCSMKAFLLLFFFDQPFGLHVLIIARWAVCLLLRRTSRAPAQAKNRNKKNKTQKLKQTVDAAAWAANVLLLPLPWPLCQFVAVLTLDTLINYLPNNPNDYYFISATV